MILVDNIDIKVVSHKEEVMELLNQNVKASLEAVGMQAENNAKIEITKLVYDTPESPNYVRTGNLRNSLSHADDGVSSVYVGTNVEYAPYVEFGVKGRPGRPYLKNAITKHIDEYKAIYERYLSM